MCSENLNNILPEPSEELKCVSEKLASIIRARITENGPIPFSDYMEMALYEPGLGYYSAGLQKFGEGGDFITAPQLGDVFARCLANQVAEVADALVQGEPGDYEIVEAGAGSGILAADLLKALQDSHPPTRYRILERSAHLQQVQKETLGRLVPQWMDRISWLSEPPTEDWHGVFLANEVLDALTVDRFSIESDGIRQLRVANGPEGFEWEKAPCEDNIHDSVQAILSSLEREPTIGFQSELNTHLAAWLQAVTTGLREGVALFIDYGYTRNDYYHPQRGDGTLICHYQHRAHGNPFKWPGLTDISASVDFTALAESADECGLTVCGYTTQAMFLLGCGLDGLLADSQSLPERQKLKVNNQARHLTLPGEMGERFQVMALGRRLDDELADDLMGFSIADYCHRL